MNVLSIYIAVIAPLLICAEVTQKFPTSGSQFSELLPSSAMDNNDDQFEHLSTSNSRPIDPKFPNADENILYIDGVNDCSNGNTDRCTSLSQALETLPQPTEEDDTFTVLSYTFFLQTAVSDTTERPLLVNHSLAIKPLGNASILITNATTPTSRFCTMGSSILKEEITVSFSNIPIYVESTRRYPVAGTPFRIESGIGADVYFSLNSLTVTTNNEDGEPSYHKAPFIFAMKGKVTLSAVAFSKATFFKDTGSTSQVSYLYIDGADLKISNLCSFTHITGEGTGDEDTSALRAVLNPGGTFFIVGCSFTKCTSMRRGGAVSLALNGGALTMGGMQFNQEVQFIQCHSAEEAGAIYIYTTTTLVPTFNRIEYIDCTVDSTTGHGKSVLFHSKDANTNRTFWIRTMDELLKGQHPALNDFIAYNGSSGSIDLYDAKLTYAYTIHLNNEGLESCTYIDTPLGSTKCNSLDRALFLVRSSELPMGNSVEIDEGTTLRPTNFTGTAHVTCSIEGRGNSVFVGITNLISNPLLTVGPSIIYEDESKKPADLVGNGEDLEIIITLRDLTFKIERTEAVYMRETLFRTNNELVIVKSDGNETRVSEKMHYLEFDSVTVESGLPADSKTRIVPQAYTVCPIIEAAAGTYVILKNMKFVDLAFINSTNGCPSLISSTEATCIFRATNFEDITLQDAPLLDISINRNSFGVEMPTGYSRIDLTTVNVFRNIERREGSGCIFNVDLTQLSSTDEEPYLPITNSYFTKCRAPNGNGGAINIRGITSADQVYFESVLFSGCRGIIGNRLYAIAESITVAELQKSWANVETNNLMNNDYQVKIGLADPVPIFDHTTKVDFIMIDEERGDDAGTTNGACGYPWTIPCQSMYMANSHVTKVTTTIAISPGTYSPDTRPITFLQSLVVRGEAPTNSFVLQDVRTVAGGVFVVSAELVDGIVEVEKLTFRLISEIFLPGETEGVEKPLTSSVFTCEGYSTLRLINVAFEMGALTNASMFQYTYLDSPLIVSTHGTLMLYDSTFTDLVFGMGRACLSADKGVTLTIAGCTWSNITLQSRPLLNIGGVASELILDHYDETPNTFMNINRESGNGAVISQNLGDIYGINLRYATFINCTSTGNDGEDNPAATALAGAIYFDLISSNGTFTIDNDTVDFQLLASPETHEVTYTTESGAEATKTVPYFDSSFNAPWKSAITFAAEDAKYAWIDPNQDDLTEVNDNTYMKNLSHYERYYWNSDDVNVYQMYYFYILAGSKISCNNTMQYSFRNHINEGSVRRTTAMIDSTGGDTPGCGVDGDGAVPCFSILQAFTNLVPSSNQERIILKSGQHSSLAGAHTRIDRPVNITGQQLRNVIRTTIVQEEDFFVTSSSSPIFFSIMNIQSYSNIPQGSFVRNTGSGGLTLFWLSITGDKKTVTRRLVSPFLTSTVGPILLKKVTVKTIEVVNCTFMTVSGGSITITDCSFTDVEGHSPGTGGTVIAFTLATAAPFLVNSTTFDTCHTQRNGGAISITVASAGVVTIGQTGAPVTFVNNSAVYYGGSIYITGTQKWSSLTFTDVTFDGHTGADPVAHAREGAYLYYESANANADITFEDIVPIISQYRTVDDEFNVKLSTSSTPVNMYELQPYLILAVINATNAANCGSKATPCDTLSSIKKSSLFSQCSLIWLDAGAVEPADDYIVIEKDLNITGHTRDGVTSYIKFATVAVKNADGSWDKQKSFDTPLIHIEPPRGAKNAYVRITHAIFAATTSPVSGAQIWNRLIYAEVGCHLVLDNVQFTVYKTEENTVLERSVIYASQCEMLEFYDIYFSHLTLESVSLLTLPVKNEFKVHTTSTFEYITRKEGNGAVISETLQDQDKLLFSNVIFSNCKCLTGSGGAIYLSYEKGKLQIGDTTDPETGTYSKTQFINCTAQGAGGAIYFNFTGTIPPSVDPTADMYFILQNVDFIGDESIYTNSTGRYAFAEGQKGVVDDIRFWKSLIKKTDEVGWYQYTLNDETDETKKINDVFKVVPDSVTVDPGHTDPEGSTNDADPTAALCVICPTIEYSLLTYAAFAEEIQLGFVEHTALLNVNIDHSVTIKGGSSTTIFYHAIDEKDDRFFNVHGKRIVVTFKHFTLDVMTGKPDYNSAYHSVRVAFVSDGATLVLDTMTFTDSEDEAKKRPLNGSFIVSTDGYVNIIDTSFSLIDTGIRQLLNVGTHSGAFTMTGHNLFNTIKSAYPYDYGTLLNVTLRTGEGIHICNANISSCVPWETGALIYLAIEDEPADGALKFANLTFQSATESYSNAVQPVYVIVESTLTDYVQNAGFIWTALQQISADADPYEANSFLWVNPDENEKYENGTVKRINFRDLKNYRYKIYYVDIAGDSADCEEATPCPYLHYAADLANAAEAQDLYVQVAQGHLNTDAMKATFLRTAVVSGTVTDEGIQTNFAYTREATGSLAILTVGISQDRKEDVNTTFINFTVTVTSIKGNEIYVPLFGVVSQYDHTAILTLHTVVVTLNTDLDVTIKTGPIQATLIDASSGFLCLYDVTMTGIVLQSHPLITATPQTVVDGVVTSHCGLLFEGTNTFDSITRNEGNGSVLSLYLHDNAHLTLANLAFSLCNAKIGGAIYLSISANVSNAEFDWDADNINFLNPGTFDDGAYFYLYFEDLAYISDEYQQKYRELVMKQTDVRNLFVIEIRSGRYNDIYQFYEVHENPIIMSDDPTVSKFTLFREAIEQFNADPTATRIFVKRHLTQVPVNLNITRNLAMSAVFDTREQARVPITKLSETLFTVIGTTKLVNLAVNDLDFRLDSGTDSPIDASIFETTGDYSTLYLASCTFQPGSVGIQHPLTVPIINCLQGTLGLNKVVFKNLVTKDVAFFKLPADLDNFGVYAMSTFKNLTRQSGNGCVFEETVEASDILTFKNLKFDNCIAENGHGGVGAFILHYKAGFVLDATTFTNCHAKGTVGDEKAKGGALWLALEGTTIAFSFGSTTVSGNTASDGQSIYIDVTSTAPPTEEVWIATVRDMSGVESGDLISLIDTDGIRSHVDLKQYIPVDPVAAAAESKKGDGGGIKSWVIILIVVIAVVVVVGAIIFVFCCCRGKKDSA